MLTEPLFHSRDHDLDVVEAKDGVQVIVGRGRTNTWPLSATLPPEDIARLAHALNQWIARFTTNA